MSGSSNSSFIPKRNPIKKSRKTVSRRVYTFTVVSYLFLFSVLLASAGVFLYGQYVDRQLEDEIAVLTTEIQRFNSEELASVKAFDARLRLAAERVSHSVSVASLFSAFEAATVGTVVFESLGLERSGDDHFSIATAIRTDSFDSSIFQRGVYGADGVITKVVIEDLKKTTAARSEDETLQNQSTFISDNDDVYVTFDATLLVDIAAVPYDPSAYSAPAVPVPPVNIPPASAPSATTTETEANLNQS